MCDLDSEKSIISNKYHYTYITIENYENVMLII